LGHLEAKAEASADMGALAEVLGNLETMAEGMSGVEVGVSASASWYSPSYLKVCKVFQRKSLSLDFGHALSAEARPGIGRASFAFLIKE
jgi:hypothetical protein